MAWDITGRVRANAIGVSTAAHLFDGVPRSMSPDRMEDARLIATELVASLSRRDQGPGSLQVTLRWDGATLRIEVSQGGSMPFLPPHPAGVDGFGRLLMLDALTDRWGADPVAGTLWAVLSDRPVPPRARG